MVVPQPFLEQTDAISNIHYFQSVMTSQAAVTLVIFITLKIVHFAKWGYDMQENNENNEKKRQGDGETEEEGRLPKWDQKSWDLYFPIIFANHIAASALIICYIPHIYACVIAYAHFICFCGLLIVNIFIQSEAKVMVSRILWALMCLFNVMLIIGGLTGVSQVLK